MNAKRWLIGPLAACCLVASLHAEPGQSLQDKGQADKVAKKVAKAKGAAERAEDEREALQRFRHELEEYTELHGRQLAKLGSQKETPAAQHKLAQAIAAKRAGAAQGDIFRSETEPLFRRLVAEQLRGPEALDARKAVVDGNPGQEKDSLPFAPRVNAAYPVGAPRSTVPPSVLLALPQLPKCLEYRFVGRDLILVDSVAQMIVDFLPAAAPALAAK